jgi:hypothetical protein
MRVFPMLCCAMLCCAMLWVAWLGFECHGLCFKNGMEKENGLKSFLSGGIDLTRLLVCFKREIYWNVGTSGFIWLRSFLTIFPCDH